MAGQGDIIINSLEGLDNLTDESYPRTVMNNIDTIFRHGRDEYSSEDLKILLDTKFFVLNLYFDYYHPQI